jgi:SAM-dependent methyltransferase
VLYGLTVFLGAFLLFLIEPVIAKVLLPWFGGTAAVWTMCLVFFQSVLLLGYVYADSTTRFLRARAQAFLHIGLLAACLAFLPLAPNSSWKPTPSEDPTWRILALLSASIGLPYLLLSATSPLIQRWYSRSNGASQPYRLFSLSNFASLLALVSYPIFIEPRISTHVQMNAWSVLFVCFVGLCASSAWKSRDGQEIIRAEGDATRPRVIWLALAACGSMLLLAITNHLCQNVAPVPLLWVLPLALYLLTFVIAFHQRAWYPRTVLMRLLAVALASLGYLLYDTDVIEVVQLGVPVSCFALFVGCLFCHSELNRLRPEARHLTSFYLMISLGGALGAVLVGLVAPRVFNGIYELPAALVLSAILAAVLTWREGWSARVLWGGVSAALAFGMAMYVRTYEANSLVLMRNFYGALRVKQSPGIGPRQQRSLYHGSVRHGAQFIQLPMRLQPTTYYGVNSGVGIALRSCCEGPKRVGVIGLGAGTVAAYGAAGDYFRFYEINPQVVHLANVLFSYLRESKARSDIVLGDARLSLENESPQQFDVLVIDAFSGDAIPVHLLTKEAMAQYLHHLKPDGILAFHTSNQYLRLEPAVQQLADAYGYPARLVASDGNDDQLVSRAEWVLATRRHDFLPERKIIEIPAGLKPWTDDYNNLFQILRPMFPQ